MVDLKIKNHAALDSLTKGVATRTDIDTLVAMGNITEAFARMGFGSGYEEVVKEGLLALRAVGKRGAESGRFILKAAEMTALNEFMELHDAQMEVVTLRDMDEAIALVREEFRLKKMTPIVEKT
jgi:hypothetical protein